MKYFALLLLVLFTANFAFAQGLKLMLPIGHTEEILTTSISSDGKYLISGSRDKNAIVWDLYSGKEVFRQSGHSHLIHTSAIDSEMSVIVTGSWDGTIQVWNFKTGIRVNILENVGFVIDSKFDPRDKQIVAFTNGENVFLWNYIKNTLDTLEHNSFKQQSFEGISYSSDGLYLAAAGWYGKVIIWDNITHEEEHIIDGEYNSRVNDLSFKPKTHILTFITSGSQKSITHFDVEKKSVVLTDDYPPQITGTDLSLAYNLQGNKIAIGSNEGSLSVFDATTLNAFFIKSKNIAPVNTVLFNPLNDNLIVGTSYGFLGIWDVGTEKRLKALNGNASRIYDVSFSPDNKQFAIADDNSLKIIDIKNARIIKRFSLNEEGFRAVDYHPDGKSLVTAIYDSIYFLKSADMHVDKRYNFYTESSSIKIKYNKDGSKLLALGSSGYLNIFHAGSMSVVNRSSANVAKDAVISEDGTWFGGVEVDNNGYPIVWAKKVDPQEQSSKPLYLENSQGQSVAFNKSSTKVIFGSSTGVVIKSLLSGDKIDSLNVEDVGVSGISKAVFSFNEEKILISTFTGKLIIWDQINSSTHVVSFPDPLTDIILSNDGNIVVLKSNFRLYFLSSKDFTQLYSFSIIDNDVFYQLPSGYYMSTPEASKMLHYVTDDLEVISFEQLDTKYNRPDKILKALESTDDALIESYRKAYEKRIKKLDIDTTAFQDNYNVPEADFKNRSAIKFEHLNNQLLLHIKGKDKHYKLARFNVWINEVPLFGMRGINIRNRNTSQFDTTITVTLSQGENIIETSVSNINAIESYRMPLHVNCTPKSIEEVKVYFIGIGINQFADSRNDLKWSVKDVRDLTKSLKEKYGNALVVDTLFNQNVTAANILALKRKLLKSSVNDKIILSYSGHGLLSSDYDYYLSTYNVNFENPDQGGLAYDELEKLIDGIPARRKLMLIDACHSGEVDKDELIKLASAEAELDRTGISGSRGVKTRNVSSSKLGIKNSFELMQELFVNVSRSTGATVISAAAGTQFALERNELQNGVFTYTILELMKQQESATVTELRQYVNQRVPELTSGLQVPTTRNETKAVDWKIW